MTLRNKPAIALLMLALCCVHASAADPEDLSQADIQCLQTLAAASPSVNLAVNRIAGHCRARPRTAVVNWLLGTPLLAATASAIAQRVETGSPPAVGASGRSGVDSVPQPSAAVCAQLAALAGLPQSQACAARALPTAPR